jgi:formylglycine-generating enzyme required for sulfatase activity
MPVVAVSWFDAVAYCGWLSVTAGLEVRLPTEIERERAARGGLEAARWPWGDEPPEARAERRALAVRAGPHRPGVACANGYGLRCMGDNVHEWCADWHEAIRPGRPRRRASRGGSWRHSVPFSRVSARSSLPPDRRYDDYGFRLACDVP